MHLLDRLRRFSDSFLMVPSLFILGEIILAEALILLDRHLHIQTSDADSLVFITVGTEGAYWILSSVASTMLSVATMAFSITISVMSGASNVFGPRLVRNFMSDRGNQIVLGVFTSTFLYCILVLRSVQSEEFSSGDGAFVPHIAVNIAVALAVACVGVLIYFINHIANGIQVSTLASNVQNKFSAMVDRWFFSSPTQGDVYEDHFEGIIDDNFTYDIYAERSGYVIDIEVLRLATKIRDDDVKLRLLCTTGDHIVEGERIAVLSFKEELEPADQERIISAVRASFSLNHSRTSYDDIRFAQQQIIELSVRSLSKSSNDPFTFTNAIHELTVGLTHAAQGSNNRNAVFVAGEACIQFIPVTSAILIDEAFDGIRRYAINDSHAVLDLIEMAGKIAELGTDQLAIARAKWHAAVLLSGYHATGPTDHDLSRVQSVYQKYFSLPDNEPRVAVQE